MNGPVLGVSGGSALGLPVASDRCILPSNDTQKPETSKASRVLVVDDNDRARRFFAQTLSAAGYDVAEAATGAGALRAAAEGPDLIILDVKLPDIDGLEVCRRLKEDPTTATIPVLQVSGLYRGAAVKARALDGGADAYLPLPATAAELGAMVRSLLRVRLEQQASEERLLRKRLAQAGAIIEVGTAITSSLDLGAVLELIVDRACHLLDTPRSAIAVVDGASDTPAIRFVARRGLGPSFE
ncbi:MAG: response regulator, partial [Candidatus Rokuibacteriota bacterium]